MVCNKGLMSSIQKEGTKHMLENIYWVYPTMFILSGFKHIENIEKHIENTE